MQGLFQGTSGRALFILLCAIAYFMGLAPHLLAWFTAGSPPDALIWNMTHFHVSYADFGFMRRGLLGSVMAPILARFEDGSDAEYAVMLGLDALICLGLIVTAAHLFLRKDSAQIGQSWLLVALVISPVGFVQLGYDAARLDHVNFALAALAMAAVARGWVIPAAVLVTAMMLVHEAALFYAVPVVTAFAYLKRRSLIDGALIALPALIAAIALVIWGAVEVDLSAALPPEVNLAASVWTRELLEPARGFPPLHYLIAAYLAAIPLILLWRHYSLNRTAPDLLFLAPFAGLALFALGVDYGRWSHCIFFSTLMVIAAAPSLGRVRDVDLGPLPLRAILIPWLLPLGPIGIAVLYPFIPWIV